MTIHKVLAAYATGDSTTLIDLSAKPSSFQLVAARKLVKLAMRNGSADGLSRLPADAMVGYETELVALFCAKQELQLLTLMLKHSGDAGWLAELCKYPGMMDALPVRTTLRRKTLTAEQFQLLLVRYGVCEYLGGLVSEHPEIAGHAVLMEPALLEHLDGRVVDGAENALRELALGRWMGHKLTAKRMSVTEIRLCYDELGYKSFDELRIDVGTERAVQLYGRDISLYLLLEIHKSNPQAVEEYLARQPLSLRTRFQAALAFV